MTLTNREAAILSLYTGFTFINFGEIHKVAEELYGYPIFSHEFANEKLCSRLKDLATHEAREIFNTIKYEN